MKKRILFIGIAMYRAGTEKAFISLAEHLDYDRFDVDLLLAKKTGPLMDELPPQINVIEMSAFGDMFLLSSHNAYKTVWRDVIRRHPSSAFVVARYFVSLLLHKSRRADIASEMWVDLMRRYAPVFDNGVDYDAAIAYWGDRTMFYMVDKVPRAKKKLAWLHFDYGNPRRKDRLYLPYFKACDKVVTVSEAVDAALKNALPEIAGRCVCLPNIIDAAQIRTKALEGDSFPDRFFKGLRIVSVMRLSEQKGVDFIPPVMKRLRGDGYDVRWYILGDGDDAARKSFAEAALQCGVADTLFLLGSKENPYPYLRDADIFVLPSRYEGKPITVEEAKILMKPIVATDYVSAREQLADGEYGVICDISEDAVYHAVKGLLDDSAKRDRLTVMLSKQNFGNTDRMRDFYDLIG